VEYGDQVEVQHTVRGTVQRVDRASYEELLSFQRFRPIAKHHTPWLEAGVLVRPFEDRPEHHEGLRSGTEARLARDYQDWYWPREVEAEREYRWLGHSIVKMPSDLFFYQELMTERRLKSVLEVGYGDGGGLWFFGGILRLLGGGTVVGVDRERSERLPSFEQLSGVHVELLHGDGHDGATVQAAQRLRPVGFALVIIDAEPLPEAKAALLGRWAPLVSEGGYLVVEDVDSPECRGGAMAELLDTFLLDNPAFGIAIEQARHPLLKARGAVFRRLPCPHALELP
jgi:cephalosporin hydroxylase